MNDSNISGLIIEGIAGTGKTTTLYALLDDKRWLQKLYLSSYVLSEHHTLRVLENRALAKTLTKQDCIEVLNTHVNYLEKLKTNLEQTDWLERDRTAQKLPFIFERFHLTHAYHFDQVNWSDVKAIDQRLAALNTKLCVFTIDPEDMQKRIIEDYRKSGWQEYLKTLGSNDNEIKAHFVREQEKIILLAKQTVLPVKVFDTSSLSTQQLVDGVLDFWLN